MLYPRTVHFSYSCVRHTDGQYEVLRLGQLQMRYPSQNMVHVLLHLN
jgi:hypothetical protein